MKGSLKFCFGLGLICSLVACGGGGGESGGAPTPDPNAKTNTGSGTNTSTGSGTSSGDNLVFKNLTTTATLSVCEGSARGSALAIPGLKGVKGKILYSRQPSVSNTLPEKELHCATPDGDIDEVLATVQADIFSIAWKPDLKAIAFSGKHDLVFSFQNSDLFLLRGVSTPAALSLVSKTKIESLALAKGLELHRITNGPLHDSIKASCTKTGTVRIKVQNGNAIGSTTGAVALDFHVQGMKGAPKNLTVDSGSTETLDIPDVCDFGEGVQQYVSARDTVGRFNNNVPGFPIDNATWYGAGFFVDVKAGETAEMPGLFSFTTSGLTSPPRVQGVTWNRDGTKVLYTLAGGLSEMNLQTGDLTGPGVTSISSGSLYAGSFINYSPNEDLALVAPWSGDTIQLLDTTKKDFDTAKKDQVKCGLLCFFDWLPDGSGFLYGAGANLYKYTLATKQSVGVATLNNASIHEIALSPDGLYVAMLVSENQTSNQRGLWIMKVDDVNFLHPLVKEGNPVGLDWK